MKNFFKVEIKKNVFLNLIIEVLCSFFIFCCYGLMLKIFFFFKFSLIKVIMCNFIYYVKVFCFFVIIFYY